MINKLSISIFKIPYYIFAAFLCKEFSLWNRILNNWSKKEIFVLRIFFPILTFIWFFSKVKFTVCSIGGNKGTMKKLFFSHLKLHLNPLTAFLSSLAFLNGLSFIQFLNQKNELHLILNVEKLQLTNQLNSHKS